MLGDHPCGVHVEESHSVTPFVAKYSFMAFAKMSALRQNSHNRLKAQKRSHFDQKDPNGLLSLTEQALSSTCQDVQLCKVKESERFATRGAWQEHCPIRSRPHSPGMTALTTKSSDQPSALLV